MPAGTTEAVAVVGLMAQEDAKDPRVDAASGLLNEGELTTWVEAARERGAAESSVEV